MYSFSVRALGAIFHVCTVCSFFWNPFFSGQVSEVHPASSVRMEEADVQRIIYGVPILLYHYVEQIKDPGDTIRISLNTRPEIFQNQVETLLAAGYTFITMADLGMSLEGTLLLPPKPAVLTFDDGYKDFYTDVYPFLVRKNIKATVFVVSRFVGKPNYLSAKEITELSRSGLVEIAAHTRHHVDVTSHTQQLTEEIAGSKTDLERLTGNTVRSFAYPYGTFSPVTKREVSRHFITAVSTSNGSFRSFDRYSIDRIRPRDLSGTFLTAYITSLLDTRRTASQLTNK